MHNIFLWDEPALNGLSIAKKNAAIYSALKAYRIKNPVNIVSALLAIFILVLIPSALFAYYFSYTASVSWAAIVTLILNIRMAKNEAPNIKPYLAEVKK